ncbi:MAG TPA: ABC transporter ATP-binding protein, partial [Chloroflexi bacterium]|nr:ABC transporter ATP-binding protein [Chloroflexota bacterium]
MGFILDGLDTEAYDRQYGDLVLLRRIVGYFRQRARWIIISGLAILGRSSLEAAVPLVIARSIDMLAEQPSAGTMALLVGGLLLLEIASWALNWVRQRYAARAIGDVVLALRRDVFDAVIRHDLSFYDEQPTGRIVSRVTSDTDDFAETVDLVMNLVSQILTVTILIVVAFRISAQLAIMALALTPVVFVIALSFRRLARRVTQNARRVLARVNANIQESVSGIAVAKAFRREGAMYDEFVTLNRQSFRVNLLRGWTLNTIFPVLSGTFGIA